VAFANRPATTPPLTCALTWPNSGPTRAIAIAVIDLEWQLQRVGGHPLTHKQVLKADGSTDTLPLPPICVTALRIAKRNHDAARAGDWPETYICGKNTGLCSPPGTDARSSRGISTVRLTSGARGTESAGS
jgi:hypothetical protein